MTSSRRLDPVRPPAGRLRRAPHPLAEDFRTPVRGHLFAAAPPGAQRPRAGAPATLVREPDNPRDPYAVAVWTADATPWRLGYLDRAVAARLAPRIDAGERFVAELAGWVAAPGGRWDRPLLRVVGGGPPVGSGRGLWGRPPASTRRVLPGDR